METIQQVRTRFDSAFKRYTTHDMNVRNLCAAVSEHTGDEAVQALCVESQLRSDAESEYQSARSDYANRLLAD
jgi:hypothetical protein